MALSSTAMGLLGGVAAVGIIGTAAVFLAPPTQEPQAALAAPEDALPEGAENFAPDAEAVAAEPTNDPQIAEEPEPVIVNAPSLDTFFRQPDGTAVIAGKADPGQIVDIMLGTERLERVTTAADGAWGTVLFLEPSDQPRRLRLIGDPDVAAVAAAETIIVPPTVIEAPVDVAIAAPLIADTLSDVPAAPDTSDVITTEQLALSAPIGDVAAQVETIATAANDATPDVDTGSSAVDVAVVGQDAFAAPIEGASVDVASADPTLDNAGPDVPDYAPPTLIAGANGVRVLPSAGSAARPAVDANIALDTITYDPQGEVLLAGRGATDGFVQVYLDNKPVTTSPISADGDWQTDLPADVDTGVYTLRIDEVDTAGVVQSRIETPFKLEEPADVVAALAEETAAAGFDVAVKIVQPGATLWAIAEERLGDGILYVSVFEANRDRIRDPDLIYPGQVLSIPEATTD